MIRLAIKNRDHILCISIISGVIFLNLFRTGYIQGSIVLTDVTKDTGMTFKHTDGGSGRFYIMETVSAGIALFDYDKDGDIDI